MKQSYRIKGSITVEAALVLPVFVYGIIAFMYFMQIIYIQECIQAGITEVAKEASRYGFIYDNLIHGDTSETIEKDTEQIQDEEDTNSIFKSIVDGSFYKIRLNDYMEKSNISDSCIVGGKAGIVMLLSSFMEEDEHIDVIAVYHIKIPIPIIAVNGFTMVQRVRTRAFIGRDYNENGNDNSGAGDHSEEQMVYITESGTVYHNKRSCTHLQLSIKPAVLDELELLRNENGGKYKACELCADNVSVSNGTTVYVTKEGDRYHTSLSCSGLKRTIYEIPLSQVDGRNLCKRCQ